MCGIAGLLAVDGSEPAALVARMAQILAHRGPDDDGLWIDHSTGVALGHRRLAIVDLSATGYQPMLSSDGRYVLVYNGEIYNHLVLREALSREGRSVPWRGHSDSETLIECIAAWGIEKTASRAAGMFALAVWDRTSQTLLLARDRFGEKPLYYTQSGARFAFASELRAVRLLPGFDGEIDPGALRGLVERGYVPPDRCIYANARQVPPGGWMRIDRQGDISAQGFYYDFASVAQAGEESPILDYQTALQSLRETLGNAVERQLMSDVPLGVLLSGGVDSSLITALACERAGERVKTFSIGFSERGFDEAPAARAVAEHFGTDHHELYVTSAMALSTLDRLADVWDEPFADASQIPTLIVAEFARKHVTVALCGDGGDELFGGYQRHIALPLMHKWLQLTGPAGRFMAHLGARASPSFWYALASRLQGGPRPPFLGHKIKRLLQLASEESDLQHLYDRFLNDWDGYRSPVLSHDDPGSTFPSRHLDERAATVMLADVLGYLPGDILAKTDRASMAVSLESRVPFLDPEVAELSTRILLRHKIRGGKGKVILRDLLSSYLPASLTERPKSGFSIPLAEWLRGPLRGWAEDLLSSMKAQEPRLDAVLIGARWQAHLAGREDASQALWNVLMYLSWRQRQHYP